MITEDQVPSASLAEDVKTVQWSQVINTFRLPSILGIELRVHWSLALSLAAIASVVSQGAPLNLAQGTSNLHAWGLGLVAALAFFASILMHELAHSLVARHLGLRVASITLFLFDGASKIERPRTAQQEWTMAVAGPLTNLALAAFFGTCYLALHVLDVEGISVLAGISGVNMLLGLFNLLPGLPMDGGRVLRGYMWSRCRNYLEATRRLSRIANYLSLFGTAVGLILLPFSPVAGLVVASTCNLMRFSSASSYKKLLAGTPA